MGFAASIDKHWGALSLAFFFLKKKHWRVCGIPAHSRGEVSNYVMCGRRDLGGPGPECANALHSGTYMDAKRMVWALQQVLTSTVVH